MIENKNQIIVNSIFFLMLFFTSLSLLTSEFSLLFSQLLLLLCEDGRFFAKVTTLLFLAGFCVCIFYLIRPTCETYSLANRIIIVALSCFYMFSFVMAALANSGTTNRTLSALYDMDYGTYNFANNFLFYGFCIAFIFAPILLFLSSISCDVNNKIGKFLQLMYPSLNVIIFAIATIAIQPYYNQNHILGYINFILFLASMGLLSFVYARYNALFRFYEYANILLLVFFVMIVLSSANVLNNCDYVNLRSCFMLFTFIAWNIDWMDRMSKS